MIEKKLVECCAPTLASLKSANLFPLYGVKDNSLDEEIRYWNRVLEQKGITIISLKRKGDWALLYVCRKNQLRKLLKNIETVEFLKEYGYEDVNVDTALEKLKERINMSDDFPHEIGVFLDYPIGDVKGFIKNEGLNYRCKGCWKVYCNECETMKIFEKYDKCKKIYRSRWNSGYSIQKLTVAA